MYWERQQHGQLPLRHHCIGTGFLQDVAPVERALAASCAFDDAFDKTADVPSAAAAAAAQIAFQVGFAAAVHGTGTEVAAAHIVGGKTTAESLRRMAQVQEPALAQEQGSEWMMHHYGKENWGESWRGSHTRPVRVEMCHAHHRHCFPCADPPPAGGLRFPPRLRSRRAVEGAVLASRAMSETN